jgi:hypothetical protein
VVIVLAKQIAPNKIQTWGCSQPTGWKRPFVIAHMHPCWGAELACDAGTTPLAVSLIQDHQEAIPSQASTDLKYSLLATLQNADNLN